MIDPGASDAPSPARCHDFGAQRGEVAGIETDFCCIRTGQSGRIAVKCLTEDRDVLLAFYDFPAEQWMHIRTTNPIESTFATVRLRTKRTKGSGSRAACLAMVFKLTMCAERTWRALNGSTLLSDVIRGVRFVDGVKTEAA